MGGASLGGPPPAAAAPGAAQLGASAAIRRVSLHRVGLPLAAQWRPLFDSRLVFLMP